MDDRTHGHRYDHWEGELVKRLLLIASLLSLVATRSWATSATGGVVTNYTLTGTNFTAHIFTNFAYPTNIVFAEGGSVDLLVVAGGGAGGKATTSSGGGGAGGLIYTSLTVSASTYSITVGSGGVAKTSSGTGPNGADSTFSNLLTAVGGGGGGGSTSSGGNGGSGGGAQTTAGTGTAGQGNGGGIGTGVYIGGGGGAGSVGTNGSASTGAGHGGAGKAYNLSGESLFYAGGGGGYYGSGTSGTGGSGVGGDGGASPTQGMDGRGGGGGGGGTTASGKGGSGIVIVRYLGPASTNTYTVSYSSNLATSGTVPTSQIKTQGVSIVLSANTGNLARTGYTFIGWNTASNGTGTAYATGATYTADADATMYADWQTNIPPAITTHPTNVTVLVGQKATFAVAATGTPTLLYQWYTNSVLLAGATASVYTTAVLAVSDSGTVYKVIVTNAFGYIESSNAVLSVMQTNRFPNKPTIVFPTNAASGVSRVPNLTVSVSDPDEGSNLSVVFYGRTYQGGGTGEEYTVIHIPDTQNYFSSDTYVPAATAMTDWIATNRASSNIVAALQVGDVSNDGLEAQILRSTNMMYRLSNPVTTGLAEGIPWGIITGTHDSPYTAWQTYYGTNYFRDKSYWGGSYTNGDNQYNYILFTGGGVDMIAVGLSQKADEDAGAMAWARSILNLYSNRPAIVYTHALINPTTRPVPSTYAAGGPGIYNGVKDCTNVVMIIGGHTYGHGWLEETNGTRVIQLLTADYQQVGGYGQGYFRLMRFRPSVGAVDFWSYSPYLTNVMTDAVYPDSQFSFTNSMLIATNVAAPGPWVCLGTNTGVTSGQQTSRTWSGLEAGATYQWYAVVSDGSYSAQSDNSVFSTAGAVYMVTFYRRNLVIRSSNSAVKTQEGDSP